MNAFIPQPKGSKKVKYRAIFQLISQWKNWYVSGFNFTVS
jgi:hypothetical protein